MLNFEFRNPTKLIFGKDQISKVGQIPIDKKIMVTYGGGSIKKNGVYDTVMESLKNHNTIEFGGIEPNPKYETLIKAVELAKKEGVDYLLAVGGGSTIDGTKFIALAMVYDKEPWDIMINPKLAASLKPIPLASVLTLPATGSEMNCGGVISRLATAEKFPVQNSRNYPQFSILDPEVCYSLPKKQVANGIIDTYIHVMEQYLTYPSDAMVQDRMSEGVLTTLIAIAPKVMGKENDYEAFANFMYSATIGLNGFLAMGVPQDWATHMIGHELTALEGLDHAVTLAIVAPALYDVMRKEKSDKLIQYGERVFGISEGSDDEKIDKAIQKTVEFFESLGVPCTLSAHNVKQSSVDEIVNRFAQRGSKWGEKGNIDSVKTAEILKRAL